MRLFVTLLMLSTLLPLAQASDTPYQVILKDTATGTELSLPGEKTPALLHCSGSRMYTRKNFFSEGTPREVRLTTPAQGSIIITFSEGKSFRIAVVNEGKVPPLLPSNVHLKCVNGALSVEAGEEVQVMKEP